MPSMRLGVVVGTRPEAIKLAPVILEARSAFRESIDVVVVSTAQHREMLDPILRGFGITPGHDLDVMRKDQTLTQVTTRVLERMGELLESAPVDALMIQGDTTTCLATALAGFYHHVPVVHVEAGLRTHDFAHPYPEEMNRVLVGRLAELHFAPTQGSRDNLLAEGVRPEVVRVTGNTAVDAIMVTAADPEIDACFPVPEISPDRDLVLVTAHRRESFGEPFQRICDALAELVRSRPEIELLYPVHLNGRVREVVMPSLGSLDRVHLVEPLEYRPFVAAMKRAKLILTDSGGIQEEAPSLDKPVLVLRDTTERPEAAQAGAAKLVGTNPEIILREATALLENDERYRTMASVPSPFGDGQASRRILEGVTEWWAARP